MTKSRNIYQRHGLKNHPLYRVWVGMKTRCYNQNEESYKDYGGRGVVVCEGWLKNFKAFYEWAIVNGWGKGLDIDKDIIAKELGVEPLLYSPERCLFVTRKRNNNTRRDNHYVTVGGVEMSLSEACTKLNKNYKNIASLITRDGYSFEEAISYHQKDIAFGERCKHKLTVEQVKEIRSLYVPRVFSTRRLAKIYNVSQQAIIYILNGRNWKQAL